MTREQAIEIIKKEYACVDAECDIERSCSKCELMMPSKEPILEAYKMAISALEQEPCETSTDEPMTMVYPTIFCDDAISREAVLKVIDGWYEQNRDTENIEDLIILITYMGSVQPSRKGHWIVGSDTDIKGETVYWFTCSECKSDRGQHTNYCPDCGAKMNNTCVEMESSDAT